MASYRSVEHLQPSRSSRFDDLHAPLDQAPVSGIYLCTGCGREDIARRGELLPPLTDHRHTPSQGLIRWRLLVAADAKPK